MPINYTVLALLSAVFGAFANITTRYVVKKIQPQELFVISFLFISGILLLLSPWYFAFTATASSLGLLVAIISIDTIGNYFYYKSFVHSEASTVTPLLSLSPAFAFLVSWIIFTPTEPWYSYLAAIAVMILVVIFTVNVQALKHFSRSTLVPALLSAFCFGVSAIPTKLLLTDITVTNPTTVYFIRAVCIAIITLLIFRPNLRAIPLEQYRNIFLRTILVIVGWISLYYALRSGDAGIVVTLNNTAPIFVFIFGVIFLKEKITLKKLLAAGLIVVLSLTL